MTGDDCEEIARRASTESTLHDRPRCDPRLLAAGYLRLRLRPKKGAHSQLRDDVIVFDPTQPPETRAFMIAHECGHWLIRDEGWRLPPELEERAASRIAAALLLPRKAYLRDLRAGRDLARLRALWPLASSWIHVRRMAELAGDGAVATRWRGSKVDRVVTDRYEAGAKPTTIERTLARAVLAGESIEHGTSSAWLDVDGAALVLCPVEDLRAPLARASSIPPLRLTSRSRG